MTAKNCVNSPKLVLKDLCEKSFVRNVLYSSPYTVNGTDKENLFNNQDLLE